MADVINTRRQGDNTGVEVRFVDQGDGTWAEKIATFPAGTTGNPLVSSTGAQVPSSTALNSNVAEVYTLSTSGNWDPWRSARLDEGASPIAPVVQPVFHTGVAFQLYEAASRIGDGVNGGVIPIAGVPFLARGTTVYDQLHSPSTFITLAAASSVNVAWTPTAGKKFRLMRMQLSVTGDATITGGGRAEFTFNDGSSAGAPAIGVGFSVLLPGTSLSTILGGSTASLPYPGFNSGWVDLNNGLLSSSASRALTMNVSTTQFPTGEYRLNLAGSED